MNGIDGSSGFGTPFSAGGRFGGSSVDNSTLRERRLNNENRSLSTENRRLSSENRLLESRKTQLESENRGLRQDLSRLEQENRTQDNRPESGEPGALLNTYA